MEQKTHKNEFNSFLFIMYNCYKYIVLTDFNYYYKSLVIVTVLIIIAITNHKAFIPVQ